MSGRKHVSIDSSEHQRLIQDRSRLRSINENLPRILEEVRRESANDFQRRLAPLQQRQQEVDRTISSLQSDVRAREQRLQQQLQKQQRETNTAIQNEKQARMQQVRALDEQLHQEMHAQERRLTQRIQESANQVWKDTQSLVAAQERKLTGLIEREREERQKGQQALQQQLDQIAHDRQKQEEMARAWIEDAARMQTLIEGHYQHEHFAPGQVLRIGRAVEQARDNLAQGMPQAAITQAQQAYYDLSDLRLELERLEHEWQILRNAALEAARDLLTVASNNRQCQTVLDGAVVTDEQGDPITVEVDWWTDGKLSALEQEVQTLTERVGDDTTLVTTEDLQQIVARDLPSLCQRLDDVVAEAQAAVISSQMRINIADIVMDTLEQRGFAIQDATYEGDDMRQGYVAKAMDRDGGEVVAVVAPVGPGKNELTIHSYDEMQRSMDEVRARSESLSRSLQEQGVQTSAPQDTGHHADPAVRDIETVRQRKREQQRQT